MVGATRRTHTIWSILLLSSQVGCPQLYMCTVRYSHLVLLIALPLLSHAYHGCLLHVSQHDSKPSAKYDVGSSDIPHEQLTVTQDIEGTATDRCFGLVTLKLALNLFEGATGCHEWEAGFLLAEFVFSNARLFKGGTLSMTSNMQRLIHVA